ncbi:MAG: PilW family protein [Pseudomonadales bacterium]|nr:PilW family protein [Pseudomonadales bacterium]
MRTPGFYKISGLSIIELLIAMVLGLTLAAGVVQIYVGTSTTERDQDARLRMQENGRFALNFLGNEVRMAGYLGCQGSIQGSSVNNTLSAPPATLQPETGIQGWEADGTAPGEINNSANNVATVASTSAEWSTGGAGFNIPNVQAVPNSDIMRLWGGWGNSGPVTDIDNSGSDPIIQAEASIGISVDDFLIISDCEQADFVQACAVAPTGGPATTVNITLSTACNPGNIGAAFVTSQDPAEVIRLEGALYYVGKRNNDANNPPTLMRSTLTAIGTAGPAEELIEGVESMQLLYGVNVDQDVRATVDAYLTADQVTNWDEVISVRVSLLLQSVNDGTVPAPQSYTFDGVTYDGGVGNGELPADERVRRVFTATISLRNRALGT